MSEHSTKEKIFRATIFLIVLLVVASTWWPEESSFPTAVAKVGDTNISHQDIAYQIAVAKAYGTTMQTSTALVVLIQETQENEVARSVGVVVSRDEMDAFSPAVERNSESPRVLSAVKIAFDGEDDAYRRIYLEPKLLHQKLRAWFSRDAKVQQIPHSFVEQAYTQTLAGEAFEQVADTLELEYKQQEYNIEKQEAPNTLQLYFQPGESMASSFQTLLDGLKEGEIAATIVEDEKLYRVVRLLEKYELDGHHVYTTEEIVVPKRSFDIWFKQQVTNVSVKLLDEELRTAIAQQYPMLPWIDLKH